MPIWLSFQILKSCILPSLTSVQIISLRLIYESARTRLREITKGNQSGGLRHGFQALWFSSGVIAVPNPPYGLLIVVGGASRLPLPHKISVSPAILPLPNYDEMLIIRIRMRANTRSILNGKVNLRYSMISI